jgi:hypothetical protein
MPMRASAGSGGKGISSMTLTSGTPTRAPATTTRKWQDAGGGRRGRWLALVRSAAMPGGYLGLGEQDPLNLPFRVDAPIGTEKPIPEIVDYRKIAIGIPVVEKMELLLSPEPGKSSQP